MAIYRLSMKICREAMTKKIDYIQRNGKYNKGKKAEELRETWSKNLPTWAKDAHDFWSAIEDYEKSGQVQARGIELALPIELSSNDQRKLVEQFCNENLDNHAYTVAIHDSLSGSNPHAHIYFSERKIDKGKEEPDRNHYCKQRSGYAKDRAITGSGRKKWLIKVRKSWENEINNALEKSGRNEKVSCESLKAQGIDRIPQIHVGYKDYSLLRRTGKPGIRMQRNNEILNANQLVLDLSKENKAYDEELAKIEAQKEDIERKIAEEKKRQEVAAVNRRIAALDQFVESKNKEESKEKQKNEEKQKQKEKTESQSLEKKEDINRQVIEGKEQKRIGLSDNKEQGEKNLTEQEKRESEKQIHSAFSNTEKQQTEKRQQPERNTIKKQEKMVHNGKEIQEQKNVKENQAKEEKQSRPRKKISSIVRMPSRKGSKPVMLVFEDGSSRKYTPQNYEKIFLEHQADLDEYYTRKPNVKPENRLTMERLSGEIENGRGNGLRKGNGR